MVVLIFRQHAANPYFGHILDTPDWAFDKTVEVNLRGYFYMSVEAGKMMRDQGGGSIINTASVNALQPGMFQGIYDQILRQGCGHFGVRVNALLPGLTKTKFAGALFEDIRPDGRHWYLASDAASYTTGECIVVDDHLGAGRLKCLMKLIQKCSNFDWSFC